MNGRPRFIAPKGGMRQGGYMEQKRINELKELFLFQLLTVEELDDAIEFFHEKMYAGGMKIFSEKEKGETMYVIKNGTVKISIQEAGREKEIITFSSGEFFGEITLFEYALRTATATAVEEVSVLEISRNEFNKLFNQKPQIAAKILYQMMSEMSHRLRRKNMPGGGLIF